MRFDPEDYPAYTFREDGTPVRTAAPTRGPNTGTPNRPCIPYPASPPRYPSDRFRIQRSDDRFVTVSRDTILHACFPGLQTPCSAPEPPAGTYPLKRPYLGYAVDPRGRDGLVVRYHSWTSNKFRTPVTIRPTKPDRWGYSGYRMQDQDTGKYHRMSVEKLVPLIDPPMSYGAFFRAIAHAQKKDVDVVHETL
jgi:hypothetical protein